LLKRLPLSVLLVLAIAASASTWFYISHILKPQQIADAAAKHQPRGNLSDLYPRWLGARELLLRRRNPYSGEITREIQRGYYGRELDPSNPGDPKDQQGFAYPAYVVFLLAPTINLPFEAVQPAFRWLLIALTGASVLLWLYVLRDRSSCGTKCLFVILMLGWLPTVQGIRLQQLTLLVASLLAACGACLAAGWLALGGVLLALATIKPQLTWPIVLWLLVWAFSDWRARRRFVYAFAAMMVLLLIGAEIILPGWLRMFLEGIRQYHQYTQNQSVLVWLFGVVVGRIAEVLGVAACASVLWQLRREPASGPAFGRSFALVMALTVAIVPMFAPYNQVLLAPAILAVALGNRPVLPAIRVARMVGAVVILWPFVATIALAAGFFWITPELRVRLWPVPFYTNFMIPIFAFALSLLDGWLAPKA